MADVELDDLDRARRKIIELEIAAEEKDKRIAELEADNEELQTAWNMARTGAECHEVIAEKAEAKVRELEANNKALQDVANAQLEEIAELEAALRTIHDPERSWKNVSVESLRAFAGEALHVEELSAGHIPEKDGE